MILLAKMKGFSFFALRSQIQRRRLWPNETLPLVEPPNELDARERKTLHFNVSFFVQDCDEKQRLRGKKEIVRCMCGEN